MSISMGNLDPALQGAGQKAGLEIWRVENSRPVLVPYSSHGKFRSGDSYVVLKTNTLKSGALRHDIHYWLGQDTSQDVASTATIIAVELDVALGGRTVQYREAQGYETEKFLSYFKPCIIPQEGGVASDFKHVEAEEYKTRLYVCRGKHVAHVKEVPFTRSSLNHDAIFILDTKSKIFQFNGSNSSIQEGAKTLDVVQYIKDSYHDGICEIAVIEDGKLMANAEAGEFWGLFGGFAPLPAKTVKHEGHSTDDLPTKLFCVEKGQVRRMEADLLSRELFETSKCYILDAGMEVFVWMGKSTSLDERKSAIGAADELVSGLDRPGYHKISTSEGFETVMFKSKFDFWPQSSVSAEPEDGRGRVAALLKRQGVNVEGLLKTAPQKREFEPHIDCTGDLQVWRVNNEGRTLLSDSEQSKFYSGDCYIFQYSYPGKDKEEYLVGTWFGKHSVQGERESATLQVKKMVESMKFLPAQARICEQNEPILFFAIFQSLIVFKGGLSDGYKMEITAKDLQDDTYNGDGVALFRVQGSGPENMQAIQVEPVASSLNSSYCYILHRDSTVFTWSGNLTTYEDQELMERLLDLIKPNMQSKVQKEGTESEQFWNLLGRKSEYPSQKIARNAESDPHLFLSSFSGGTLKVSEIYNFNQDDLMTEDLFILDCHSEFFVWVGQEVDFKNRMQALSIGEKFLEHDFLLEKPSHHAPIYIVMEGSEPPFFTRFFTWDSAKSVMHGNSFQRKLSILKNGGRPIPNKPKRRTHASYGGRSAVPEKSQRSRSVSFSPDHIRMRGRSPAFNALAANFENSSSRNLSTPPPLVRKLYSKSVIEASSQVASRSAAIAALTATFEQPTPAQETKVPSSLEESPSATDSDENSMSNRMESLTIQENEEEGEAEDEVFPIYSYNRLKLSSPDPVIEIDVAKREAYLSIEEFKEKFGMSRKDFNKLPKWKQNKLKMVVELF